MQLAGVSMLLTRSADESGLWLLRLENGEALRITEGRSKDWSPTWASADSPLFFTSNREGSADLWAQSLEDDGSPVDPPVRITNGVGMRHASFSRDGTKLAYSQGRRVSNVWRMPILEERVATWGDAEQVTFDQAFIEFVDVSPDGSWIVISSDRGGNQDLWKFPASGGEMIQMTSDPAADLGAVWSPNGEEIAFYSTRTGLRQQFILPSEGGAARRVLTSEASDWSGHWSPDGHQLAFWSDRSGNFDVWVVGTDGTGARQMTTHAGRDMMPVWSPAGDEIIFTSERDGARSLYRMPVDGGEPESVSAIPAS